MKQIQTKTLLAMAAIAALLLSGCSKEPQTEDEGDGTYLSLSIDGVKAATSAQSTRATTVNESAVNDVWVLQFQMNAGSTTDGTLVGKSYIATVTDPTKITYFPQFGSDMVFYLVANSGNSSLFSATALGTTLATVKANTIPVTTTTGNNFPTNASTNLPMVGQSTNLTITSAATVPINLTRVAAKIVLTVKNLLATSYPHLTINSVQLKNVPTVYSTQTINTASGFTGTRYYPAASAANFKDYTSTTGNVTAVGTTLAYYLAPNVRGISTNTSDRLKSDLTAASGQGNFCTYVEIFGTAKASSTAPAVDVRYRLYLGGNNTNDYNLYANTAYKVDIELTGINGNDARMTITTDKFDLIQGGTDGDHTGDVGDGWDGAVVGELRNGGIVYWIDPVDPRRYKVVSMTEWSTPWAERNTYVVSAAQSDTDGRANSNAIKAYYDTEYAAGRITTAFEIAFPAAYQCYNYTGKDGIDTKGTWYLPAKSELQHLWCAFNGKAPISWYYGPNADARADATAQGIFNAYLTTAGGVVMGNNNYFWSSTKHNTDNQYTWVVDFRGGFTDGFRISGDFLVRCVRDI